jgi:hypothetical protein
MLTMIILARATMAKEINQPGLNADPLGQFTMEISPCALLA